MVFLAILAILGSILSKLIFLNVLFREDEPQYNFSDEKSKFIFIPLFTFYKNLSRDKFRFKSVALISEIYGITVFIIFGLASHKYLENYNELKLVDLVTYFVIHLILISGMLYLSIYDIVSLTIQERDVKMLCLFIVLANFFIVFVRFCYFQISGDVIFKEINLGNIDNLIAGIVIAFIIWLIIKLSNNQGMGEGDIDTMAIIGFATGWPLIFSSFFFSIIIGSIVGIIYSLKLGKMKGVIIPFVPLILTGYLLALYTGSDFFDLITS